MSPRLSTEGNRRSPRGGKRDEPWSEFHRAYLEGQDAKDEGKSEDDCPYSDGGDQNKAERGAWSLQAQWLNGFRSGGKPPASSELGKEGRFGSYEYMR
jgi:ribosome modulation factor